MHFLIYTNKLKDPGLEFTKSVQAYLQEKGQTSTLCVKEVDETTNTSHVTLPEADVMLVLGGDGTVLEATRDAGDMTLPMVGVNLGTLGYLSEIERKDVFVAIDRILSGDYKKERRMMLEGSIRKQDGKSWVQRALNDMVISRTESIHIVDIRISVNGQFLHEYHADGVIVTTATGSTGYNLSAGGPIVEPTAKLMILTPICPHTLNQRSIVLSPEDEIEISVSPRGDMPAPKVEVAADGTSFGRVEPGDKIIIKKAEKTVELIQLGQRSFLEILHQKMKD